MGGVKGYLGYYYMRGFGHRGMEKQILRFAQDDVMGAVLRMTEGQILRFAQNDTNLKN